MLFIKKIEDLTTQELLECIEPEKPDCEFSELRTPQLVAYAEYCRRNMTPRPYITYDGVMRKKIIPALLLRIEKLSDKVDILTDALSNRNRYWKG